MPELPEVEHYRRILLPLIGGGPIVLRCPPPSPTKRFPCRRVVDLINAGRYDVRDVLRKGKVLCVILTRDGIVRERDDNDDDDDDDRSRAGRSVVDGDNDDDDDDDAIATMSGGERTIYLSLHMGMTGRISSPARGVPKLESLSDDGTYPPSHSHLILRATNSGMEAAFSDPRRFGSVLVDVPGRGEEEGGGGTASRDDDDDERRPRREDRIPTFRDIAPDAWVSSGAALRSSGIVDCDSRVPSSSTVVEGLTNRKKGIKGLLLDQRAVVSGVGNWVADELLYRCRIHPDQTRLTKTEAHSLVYELHDILSTAIACLDANDDFPHDWLFHRRWRSGGGGGNAMAKDIHGRTITFIQSGGRSTAIVPSIQKKSARTSAPRAEKVDGATRRAKLENDVDRIQKVAASSSASEIPGRKRKVKEEGATLKPIPRTRKAKLVDTSDQHRKVSTSSSASDTIGKKRKVKEEGATSKPIPRTRNAKLEDASDKNRKASASSSAFEKPGRKRNVKKGGATAKPISQPTRMSRRVRMNR